MESIGRLQVSGVSYSIHNLTILWEEPDSSLVGSRNTIPYSICIKLGMIFANVKTDVDHVVKCGCAFGGVYGASGRPSLLAEFKAVFIGAGDALFRGTATTSSTLDR